MQLDAAVLVGGNVDVPAVPQNHPGVSNGTLAARPVQVHARYPNLRDARGGVPGTLARGRPMLLRNIPLRRTRARTLRAVHGPLAVAVAPSVHGLSAIP